MAPSRESRQRRQDSMEEDQQLEAMSSFPETHKCSSAEAPEKHAIHGDCSALPQVNPIMSTLEMMESDNNCSGDTVVRCNGNGVATAPHSVPLTTVSPPDPEVVRSLPPAVITPQMQQERPQVLQQQQPVQLGRRQQQQTHMNDAGQPYPTALQDRLVALFQLRAAQAAHQAREASHKVIQGELPVPHDASGQSGMDALMHEGTYGGGNGSLRPFGEAESGNGVHISGTGLGVGVRRNLTGGSNGGIDAPPGEGECTVEQVLAHRLQMQQQAQFQRIIYLSLMRQQQQQQEEGGEVAETGQLQLQQQWMWLQQQQQQHHHHHHHQQQQQQHVCAHTSAHSRAWVQNVSSPTPPPPPAPLPPHPPPHPPPHLFLYLRRVPALLALGSRSSRAWMRRRARTLRCSTEERRHKCGSRRTWRLPLLQQPWAQLVWSRLARVNRAPRLLTPTRYRLMLWTRLVMRRPAGTGDMEAEESAAEDATQAKAKV